MTQRRYHADMSQPSTIPEDRIAAFALDLIEQGRELTERGERLLRILELCSGPSVDDETSQATALGHVGLGPTGSVR